MPRRVGKEVAQQVEVAPVSPRHSEGENSPKHLPPISPLANRSYGNPIYRNDDEEKVDSAESSNKISQELQQIRKLQEEANQNMERPFMTSRAIREEVTESHRTFTVVSKKSMEHVRQQQNVPRQPVVQQMPNTQNNALGAVQVQFNRQQQNNLAGGILGPQDPVEAAFRAAEQLNANQQRYVPPACRPNAAPQPNFQNKAFQPLGLQAAPPPFDRNQLIDLVKETYGPALRPLVRPSYHKLYPDYIDRDNPFPRGFKVPEFTLFSGDASQSTIEHIGRFTIQCGEASSDDFLKLKLFPSSLTEQEFVKLAQNGLDIELGKKFEGMEFRDFFELSYKVARYENLLREESQRKAASQGTYYQDAFDLDVAEVPQRSLAKERMVWKRKESQEVAVQNESQPKVPPLKLTLLIVNENELKATFEADQQAELTSDDNFLEDMDVLQIGSISINLSCLVLTLPLVFQAKGSETTHVSNGSMLVEEEVIKVLAQEEEEEHDILLEQIIFNKPDESVARHIKLLYISAHMDGVPMNRVLVDNGAAVNVIPSFMLRTLGKNSEDLVYTDVTINDFTSGVSKSKGVLPVALTVGSKTSMSAFFVVDSFATYNALLGHDWIHSNCCVPYILHQRLIFWNGGKTEVVYADNRPFLANSNMVEAWYYDKDVGTSRFFGMDRQGRPRGITACNKPTLAKYVVDEVVHEGEEDTHTDGVTMEELDLAPVKLDDLRADVQDPLKEVNLGTEAEPCITFVSGLLPPEMRDNIICLLHEFKDCFAWDYSEMPGLDRELVEHRLPINKGYKPYKQLPRRMSPKVILKVKEEVERLHKVGFIRIARYSEWLSNIVPVVKKNGKLRVCIDFWNLNLVTPKDEYPMPVADLLVDGVARHRILSFMDGHSGYN
ncbi:hypothetical protein SLEP1_g12712 [Rubroshorea leprosula]|uniref:Uncharacterized protein n=1 Tax=Rubroshorea leprosula TaxID=152421 RepID=A0AAV5IJ94_9ROSI|nr:hypothetical protein SLEP1_g12712 [Rubroshorea leprosula]